MPDPMSGRGEHDVAELLALVRRQSELLERLGAARPVGVDELSRALGYELDRRGVPDALMLRRVTLAREWLRDIAGLLDDLERYFSLGAGRSEATS